MAKYTAKYERDEDGWWIVEVKEVQGCRSDGRTINEARRRIRQALALFVDDAKGAEIVDDVRLPGEARRALRRMTAARVKAETARAAAAAGDIQAVRVMTRDLGLSVRDTGELVGLSFQRVQQLVQAGSGARPKPQRQRARAEG